MTERQAPTRVRLYACPWPDFYASMNPCDRPLYRWLDQIPTRLRPPHLEAERRRIANATSQRQVQAWVSCEQSRYVRGVEPEPGLRIRVTGRLPGHAARAADTATADLADRVAVAFAPNNGPPPPPPCSPESDPATRPKIPFHLLHEIDRFGINGYLQHTEIAFEDNGGDVYWDGVGPWAGAKVMIAWSLNDWSLARVQSFFRTSTRLRNPKVFDHWVTFRTFGTPPPPAELLERVEPFDPRAVQIVTGTPGHGWHVVIEYTHLESGLSWVFQRWQEYATGWNPVGLGGYGTDVQVWDVVSNPLEAIRETDGRWRHRICIYQFRRPPTKVDVLYQGRLMGTGSTSILPTMTTPYIPGVSPGLASCEEEVEIRTVGATKATFRIHRIRPVPGVGALFTITVINDLHFAAGIVTPFLSGLNDGGGHGGAAPHFRLTEAYVIRNLPPHSESEPVDVLLPMHLLTPGDSDLTALHWRMSGLNVGYPVPYGQYPDGVYGAGHGQDPNLGSWPPPAYKVCENPVQYAFLLGGYLEDGTRVWNNKWDGTADLSQRLLTVPVRLAPGPEVPWVNAPGWDYPTYFDQVPFMLFYEWTAEYWTGSQWEPRSGRSRVGLSLAQALQRYGRYLTLPVADGQPMWSAYYQRWVTVFAAWPGDTADELETFLVETYVRPAYSGTWIRNFQYTTLRKPYLITGIAFQYASQPINDDPRYVHVLPLIKETTATDTVDVAIAGYW